MAALNAIARECADELREGIARVIIWKTGRNWNAQAVWLNSDDDTFEPEDMELAHKVLEQDPNAVMLNGYYCGSFGEDMTVAELAAGIRWHYDNGCNRLNDSTAFPPEPEPRPEDYEHVHELMSADRQHEDIQQSESQPDNEPVELRNPPAMNMVLTLTLPRPPPSRRDPARERARGLEGGEDDG